SGPQHPCPPLPPVRHMSVSVRYRPVMVPAMRSLTSTLTARSAGWFTVRRWIPGVLARSGLGASAGPGRDRVERADRGEVLPRVLRQRPAGQLHRDQLRWPVDVDHLAVDTQAEQDAGVRVGDPELVAVHAAGHAVVDWAVRERGPRVRAAGHDVSDPGRRDHLLARR